MEEAGTRAEGAEPTVGTATGRGGRPAAARQWLPATFVGLGVAVAFAGIVASMRPELPTGVTLVVFTATSWPVLTVGLQVLWFDRARTDREVTRGELSVEHAWFQEAGATAFVTMIGGLLFLDGVGEVLGVGWMSPVGLSHALVLGVGTFGASYLWLRARDR